MRLDRAEMLVFLLRHGEPVEPWRVFPVTLRLAQGDILSCRACLCPALRWIRHLLEALDQVQDDNNE